MSPRTASDPLEAPSDSYRLNGRLTILDQGKDSVNDPSALALDALGWILADGDRAHRFLALTGLSPDGLRGAIAERATHRAILEFLCGHEPDLVAASEALGVAAGTLAAARERIAS